MRVFQLRLDDAMCNALDERGAAAGVSRNALIEGAVMHLLSHGEVGAEWPEGHPVSLLNGCVLKFAEGWVVVGGVRRTS